MKCIVCHGEDIRAGEVNEEVERREDIVMVPVQALVCQQCGERYYDRRTMQFLEKVGRELSQGQAPLKQVGKVLLYGQSS